ncbi:MAG: helix-turn-helix domain-containing protein [Terriglobales bacterium]
MIDQRERPERLLLSRAAAAKMLGCSVGAISILVRERRLPAVRIGAKGSKRQRVMISRAAIDAFIRREERAS